MADQGLSDFETGGIGRKSSAYAHFSSRNTRLAPVKIHKPEKGFKLSQRNFRSLIFIE
jgi:hypothetical protein